MFQKKTDKIFKDLPNVFSIANDILMIGYDDGKDHGRMIRLVMQKCN